MFFTILFAVDVVVRICSSVGDTSDGGQHLDSSYQNGKGILSLTIGSCSLWSHAYSNYIYIHIHSYNYIHVNMCLRTHIYIMIYCICICMIPLFCHQPFQSQSNSIAVPFWRCFRNKVFPLDCFDQVCSTFFHNRLQQQVSKCCGLVVSLWPPKMAPPHLI